MTAQVASHRVELPEEDNEQPFQDKHQYTHLHQPYGTQYMLLGQPYTPPGQLFTPPGQMLGSPVVYQPQPFSQCAQNQLPPVEIQPYHQQVHLPQVQYPQQVAFTPQYCQYPPMQPQFLAVNVKTDAYQQMAQKQEQSTENVNKTITVKKKIVQQASRGLEGMLDMKVLTTGLVMFLLPRIAHSIQPHAPKKRGFYMGIGQFPA